MPSPLIRALAERARAAGAGRRHGGRLPRPGRGRPAHALLFFTGDPAQRSEAADVAVVLPELLAAFAGRLRAAIIARAAEAALAPRFRVVVLPEPGGDARGRPGRRAAAHPRLVGLPRAHRTLPRARTRPALPPAGRPEVRIVHTHAPDETGPDRPGQAGSAARSDAGRPQRHRRARLPGHRRRRGADPRLPARRRPVARLAAALEAQEEGAPGRLFDVTLFTADERACSPRCSARARSPPPRPCPAAWWRRCRNRCWPGCGGCASRGRTGARVADYVEVAAIPAGGAPGRRAGGTRDRARHAAGAERHERHAAAGRNRRPDGALAAGRAVACDEFLPAADDARRTWPICRPASAAARSRWRRAATAPAGCWRPARGMSGRCSTATPAARWCWTRWRSATCPPPCWPPSEDFRDSAARLRDIAAAYFA